MRIKNIQSALAENKLDAVILKNPHNRQYVTGFPSSDGTVLVTRNELFCFLDARYIEAGRAKIKGATVGLVTQKMPLKSWLYAAIKDCKIKNIGFEEDYITHAEYGRLQNMMPDCKLVCASHIMATLRASKDASELHDIKKAQAITDKVFAELLGIIRAGMSEREIAAEITYRHLLHGAMGDSFAPIVVSGKKSSLPHGVPDDNIIKNGDFLTMDFGCVYNGYCSDMTRTVAIGYATEEMQNVYNIVSRAQEAGISAARAGVVGSVIDKAGRDVIEKAGYGEYFGHSFGHSLGLYIHESPSASPLEAKKMPQGAVISAEPGIYLPEKFGVRIEDILYLTENSCENLTKSPKNLIIL